MGKDIQELADKVAENIIMTTKEVLTSEETAKYMGISMSHLYKLTMKCDIPHYKPMGKRCYFNRVEVERWLQQNRINTTAEAQARAEAYCMKKRGAL